jgi:hypothetical protein
MSRRELYPYDKSTALPHWPLVAPIVVQVLESLERVVYVKGRDHVIIVKMPDEHLSIEDGDEFTLKYPFLQAERSRDVGSHIYTGR